MLSFLFDTIRRINFAKQKNGNYSRTIFIDDSGWGFPLAGVLVGAYDTLTDSFKFKEIDVKFFQNQEFNKKSYLFEYAKKGIEIVNELNPALKSASTICCFLPKLQLSFQSISTTVIFHVLLSIKLVY